MPRDSARAKSIQIWVFLCMIANFACLAAVDFFKARHLRIVDHAEFQFYSRLTVLYALCCAVLAIATYKAIRKIKSAD